MHIMRAEIRGIENRALVGVQPKNRALKSRRSLK
jgi:hypothetical protein